MNVPLFCVDAEMAVIGALLRDNQAVDRIDGLTAQAFYHASHRDIFDATVRLIHAGKAADIVTVADAMRATDPDTQVTTAHLNAIEQETPSAANVHLYADIVRSHAQRRALVATADEIGTSAQRPDEKPAEIIDRAQTALERIAAVRVSRDPVLVARDLDAWVQELQRREDGRSRAIPTGFVDLDRKLSGGLRPGQLIVLAGRPKMGKTALALNITRNIVGDCKHTALVLSMEVSRTEIHDRNAAAALRIPLDRVLQPKTFNDGDWSKLTAGLGSMQNWRLWIDDQGGLLLSDVKAKARKVKRQHGLDLLVIDYLQLMEGEGDNRNAQIEVTTRGLKALAKELDVPIVLLSQLNRRVEDRPNKRPLPSDLRDSGAIEQDCDVALFVYRDEAYNPDTPDQGVMEVNVGLNRHGAPGVVGLAFFPEHGRIENLDVGRRFGQVLEPRRQKRLRDE
ncbi:MAG: replicative DNA helicase [Burkholderiaceae bacterium]